MSSSPSTACEVSTPPTSRSTAWSFLRLLFGAAVLVALIAWCAGRWRGEVEAFASGVVGDYGLAALAVGTFAADGFHLPVPPQFYMLISIAGGLSALPVLLAICAGSVLGGCTGFVVARYLAAIPLVARRLDRLGRRPRELFEKYGAWAVVIASVTPIAYSALCYVTGGLRLSPRLLLLACLCRIPRLIAFYYLIQLGWA